MMAKVTVSEALARVERVNQAAVDALGGDEIMVRLEGATDGLKRALQQATEGEPNGEKLAAVTASLAVMIMLIGQARIVLRECGSDVDMATHMLLEIAESDLGITRARSSRAPAN